MSEIVWVAVITGVVSLATTCINKIGNKKFLDRIAEGTKLGFEITIGYIQ